MKLNLAQLLVDMQARLDALQARLDEVDPAGTDRPRAGGSRFDADPYGPDLRLTAGVVQDALPFYDCYRVFLEGAGGVAVCGRARQSAMAATGVSDSDTITAGERVLVVVHRAERTGYILAVLPGATLDRRLSLHDQVTQASPDVRSADPYATALASRLASDLLDFSGSAPIDAGAGGEFSRGCAASGTRLHLDAQMGFLRASEECGVWAFLNDDCLRTIARTRQDWHPGGESSVVPGAAAETVTSYTGFTPYQWEAAGAPARGVTTAEAVSAVESQVTSPYKAGAEPVVDDQAPLFRFVGHAGPLPSGRRDQVHAHDPTATRVNAYSNPIPVSVLADAHTGLDGRTHESSVSGYERSMRPGLTGYVPAAALEDLPPADAPPPRPTPSGTLPDGIGSALVVDDLHAYRQYLSGVGFRQAGWTPVGDSTPEEAVDYAALAGGASVPDPTPATREVFAGVTTSEYPRAAGHAVLPNGTAVYFGPCGEEIRMGGGVLELSAPRVVIRSGQDVLVLAGRDLALRSGRDADLSAATGAVRQKAETDFHVLAGNSGLGALLLEARSASALQTFGQDGQAGGVVVKSAGSLVQYADAVYTRAEGGVVTETAGDLVSVGRQAVRYLETGGVDYYGPPAEPSSASAFGPTTRLAGNVIVDGRLLATGGGTFGEDVYVASGHVFTADADLYDGKVPALTDESADRLNAQKQDATDAASELATAGATTYTAVFTDGLAATGRPADPATIAATAFGFRPSSVIGVGAFVLYESRWQQRARLDGQNLSVLDEPVVIGPDGGPTMPYPGYEIWSGTCLRTVDLLLYDVSSGLPVTDDAVYSSAAYAPVVATTPASSYLVIR